VASTLDYAGILIFGPVATAWVEVLNTLILHGLIQRKPIRKTLFNAAVFSLTILVAGKVYQLAGGPIGVTPNLVTHGPALLLLGFTYFLVNTSAVSMILALSQGKRLWAIWRVNFRWTVSHMVAAVVVGVALAALYHALGVGGVFLFVTPLLLASYAFRLYTEARRDIIDFVGVLSGVIDEVDPYTHRHTQRVAHYAVLLARELDLPEREVETIEFASLLHDLGKIKQEHRELLLRPSALSEDERRHMASHAEFGAAMAAKLRSLKATSEIVMAHHEKLDGTGYPRGLAGQKIPLGARIVAVADAFDAMTTDRVYRPAMSLDKALVILREESGRHFDPDVVRCLERLVKAGEIRPGSTGRRPDGEAQTASGPESMLADPAVVNPPLKPSNPSLEPIH
ncbi:MAG: metal dependent phosphohydrolase, partial [bacterium]